MKKNYRTTALASAICVISSVGSCFAATIIVDNNPNHAADHRTLQAAVDAATAGDTILLGTSYAGNSYGDAIIKKKVYIYGIGYIFNDIGGPTGSINNNSSSIVGTINLLGVKGTTSCSGSIISGIASDVIYINSGVDYPAHLDSITIDRSYVPVVDISASTAGNILSNIVVTKNVIRDWININSEGSVFMRNNIIGNIQCSIGELTAVNNSVYFNESQSYFNNWNFSTHCSGEAYNNILYKYVKDEPSSFNMHNNYLANQDVAVEIIQSQIYAWNSVTDAKYQLKSDSPAKGACQNGADCGAFAGATPYILSGLPPRPRITTLEVPASVLKTDATMQVNVSAESRN